MLPAKSRPGKKFLQIVRGTGEKKGPLRRRDQPGEEWVGQNLKRGGKLGHQRKGGDTV